MEDVSNYEKIKEDARSFYSNAKMVRCPALNNELVHFTAEGFNHLMYKGKRSARNKNEQITKFKLLARAKEIIEISTTYQEYDESLSSIRRKRFKQLREESVIVHYWGLVAIIRGLRIKVIVRQIGRGQKHFWNVMPAWSAGQYRGIKIISKAKGDLVDD